MTTIQRCTINDLRALQKISATTFEETFAPQNTRKNMDDYLRTAFTDEKMTRELENPNSEFYFLDVEGTPAAYLKINIADAQTEQMGDETLEIERIYVLARYQKHGFGKMLMNFAIERAYTLKKDAIWLGVWEKNSNAIGFYKRNGFEIIGSHDFYMGDEKQTDYMMKKSL